MLKYDDPIVITGIGAVTAFGLGAEVVWSALEQGESRRVALVDEEAHASSPTPGMKVGDWKPADVLGKRGLQYLRPSAQFLLGASVLALEGAKLAEPMLDPNELGIVISSNLSGLQSISNYDYTAVNEGPQYVSPMEAPNTLANAPASHLAIRLHARALNTTIATGQCGGFDAIGYAAKALRERRARYVVVGGVEELNPRVLWVYRNAKVLPDERAEDAGHPFDRNSTGWLPSEGAAVLILERLSDALSRGIRPLAELVAWSSAFAPSNILEKRAMVLQRTAIQALSAGHLTPRDVNVVASGASGLAKQDQVEALALHNLLAENPGAYITAVKGTLGESYGASGIFQVLSTIGMINRGIIPPTVGLKQQSSAVPSLHSLSAEVQTWSGSQRGTVLLTSQDLFGSTSAVVLCGYRHEKG
jgi:3-oxoacyl-[acyl-carrier-protein] synthase II